MAKRNPSKEQRHAITQLCDAETYVPIIRECLTEEQVKALPPIHFANVQALIPELFLAHYDGIARAFDANAKTLEINVKIKLERDKDNVELTFQPVAKFKDSASANVDEDENQPSLGDISKEAKGRAPKSTAPAAPALPAPKEVPALPAPKDESPVIEAEIVEPNPPAPSGVEIVTDEVEDID
mgnify:CR=1 FL=1